MRVVLQALRDSAEWDFAGASASGLGSRIGGMLRRCFVFQC